LDSINLKIAVFRLDINFKVIADCNQFLEEGYFDIDAKNPDILLNLKVNEKLS